jgi:EmrB/QacA subfamily drug resistance transporter
MEVRDDRLVTRPMTDPSRGHFPRARWIALVVVCMAQLMSIVDGTIVNVALPQIEHDLHFTQSSLTWVLNGYLITFGSFLLLAGRLGDLIGRRRIFLAGVTGFTLASAVCGISDSQLMLVIARFVQGLAAAGSVSAIVAIIASEFPVPGERAKAMSIYTLVVSGGASLGLIAGGVITQLLNWHWIFFVNVPIGIATVALGRVWIVENEGAGIGRDVDVLGSVLITASLVIGAFAIVGAASHGWTSAHTLGFGAVSIALAGAFVALEAKLRNPIMPLRVFRIPGLPSSSAIRGLLITGMFATFFIGVLYLERIRGYGVLQTGLAFLPQTVVLAALSLGPIAWLVNRFGPRWPLLAGLCLAGAGLFVLGSAGEHTHYVPTLFGAYLLIGIGSGLAFMPLLTIAMANVPGADAGLASGIINTSLQVSASIGVAALGTISADRTHSLLARGSAGHPALLSGYQLAFQIGAGAVVVALVAALIWARPERQLSRAAPRPEPSPAES